MTKSTPSDSPTPPSPTPGEHSRDPESLGFRVFDHGHYAWFALNSGNWARQLTPYDMREASSRWLAQPTAEGGIRCLVRDIDVDRQPQSAGFDLHLGPIGDLRSIRIPNEILRTGQLPARLVIALYLDEDEDGEFFVWGDPEGKQRREHWGGTFGGDEEAGKSVPAGKPVVIDDETQFRLHNRESATASFGQLKSGEIEWLGSEDQRNTERRSGEFRGIDGGTETALYVGLIDNGGGETVEARIHDVEVERA